MPPAAAPPGWGMARHGPASSPACTPEAERGNMQLPASTFKAKRGIRCAVERTQRAPKTPSAGP